MKLEVHVTPRSGRDIVEAGPGGELFVRVTAPPDEGRANAAVCKVVAAALGVPKSAVTVVRGRAARVKLLEVDAGEVAVVSAVSRLPKRA